MKYLVGILLLIVVYLLLHKAPTRYVVDHKLETLYKDTTIYKDKVRNVKDTLVVYKDSLVIAKEKADTVKIIVYQDVIIDKQGSIIAFQDTLIDKMDTIVMTQNKSIDSLHVEMERQKKKTKIWKTATAVVSSAGLIFYILK